jgi:hypothetical protein
MLVVLITSGLAWAALSPKSNKKPSSRDLRISLVILSGFSRPAVIQSVSWQKFSLP